MLSQTTECFSQQSTSPLTFGTLDGRPVLADFKGGEISRDGGLLLIQKLDQYLGLSERIASCFQDHREASRVEHSIEEQIAQRLYGLVLGYEDLIDHERLRDDRLMAIAVGKLQRRHGEGAPLAGKSTLNRLEKSFRQDHSEAANSRYVKTEVDQKQLEQVLLEVFFTQVTTAPKRIFLDLDVTDDQTHGQQECAHFNGYYHHSCYAPLYLFCGRHLLAARLRPSNVDPAAGALEEIQGVVGAITAQWPTTKIIVRGDSAYSREAIMSWCEKTLGVDYVFAQSGNSRLKERTDRLRDLAQQHYQHQRTHIQSRLEAHLCESTVTPEELDVLVPESVVYGCFSYQTLKSWSRSRRVVCKLTHGPKGPRTHFLVTSLSSKQVPSKKLHRDYYCPRGEMENRLKEQQLDLFSDRTSNHYFDDNQFRLWLSSFAYVLLNALRHHLLEHTPLANARVGTIRSQMLKVGAFVRISVRRIHLAMHSAFPQQELFILAHQRLIGLTNTA